MGARAWRNGLIAKLPDVRGRYTHQAGLDKITWFQVGGPAEVLFKPKDHADLQTFLKELDESIPLFILGVGSNLLVRDGGLDGVVIRLGAGFNEVSIVDNEIEVGSAVLDRNVAEYAANAGIGGLEFLCGIPGTMGGAVKMNAGCYGKEMKDVLLWADVMTRSGHIERRFKEDLAFTYRHSNIKDNEIVIRMRLKGEFADKEGVVRRMQEMLTKRELTQPIHSRTGGSTFANPSENQSAWQLIDAVGGRGLCRGGAMISELHCNFLINKGHATAHDLESLGEEVRNRIVEKFGINLRWEICRIGKP